MSDRIEEQLERALADRAATITRPRFTADDVIRAGRVTRARRRNAIARAGLAIAATISLAAVLAVNGLLWPAITGDQGDSAAPPDAVSPAELGLDVIVGDRLFPHDATPFELRLPAAEQPSQAMRTPDGWVIATSRGDSGGFSLWFRRADARTTRIGKLSGAFAVSSDGRTLVADGTIEPGTVTAYRLPTLRLIRSSGEIAAPITVGVAGDRVLTSTASGDLGPSTGYVWNLQTGQRIQTPEPVNLWGMTADGLVLQRVLARSASSDSAETGCVRLASIQPLDPVGSGYCGTEVGDPEMTGLLSQDGVWAVFGRSGQESVFVRVSDLRNHVWRAVPANLPVGTSPLFWVDSALIAVDRVEGRYFVCRPLGRCQPLAMPAGSAVRVVLVPNAVDKRTVVRNPTPE